MSHVDDGRLNALLDGELVPEEAGEVTAHLTACPECQARYREAQFFLDEAVRLLGDLQLTVPAHDEEAAAAATPPAPAPSPVAGPRRVSKTLKEAAIDIDMATGESAAILPGPLPPQPLDIDMPTRESAAILPGPLPPRRVSKTLKEAAIDVDMPTRQSVALPAEFAAPVAQETRPAAPRVRRPIRVGYGNLAWAAGVVLALFVGYRASELERGRRSPPAQAPGTLAVRGAPTQVPAGAASDRTRVPSPARPAASRTAAGGGQPAEAGRREAARTVTPAVTGAPRAPELRVSELAPVATADRAGAPAGQGAARAYMERGREPQPAARAAAGRAVAVAAEEIAPPAFHPVSMAEAVRRLDGAIRLLDGWVAGRVEAGPGVMVEGADPSREVIRVTYTDSAGRRITLDEQRVPRLEEAERGAQFALTSRADTVTVTSPGAATAVRWMDRAGFRLILSGRVPPDSLRLLLVRVR